MKMTADASILIPVVHDEIWDVTSLVPVVLKQAREKNVDVVRDWHLGVTSPLKVLQNA